MEMSDSISRDELVVLQLLEEIQQLVDLAGGETKPGEDINPRMHPAAKLYLDTRDTFEVIENLVEEHVKGKPKLLRRLSKQSSSENVGASAPKSSHESPTVSVLNDAVIDRIQEMFRHLGSLLGPSILKELRLRKLSITSILHYMKKSLLKCVDVSSWAQFLSLNEWVNLRELHFIGAPVNPHFRVQMGLKFREVVESVQAVVVDISSVFSNGELNDKGFVFRMQLLLEYVNNTVLVGYERNLGVHEKVYELAVRMLLDVLTCIAEAYENLVASRARQGQWKIDILYLVCGVYKLLRQLGQMFSSRGATQSAKGKRKAINDIRCICLRLLVHLAIRSGPASVVLDTLANKVQADSFEQYADVDTISEMEYHVVSIVQSVDPDGDILGDFGNDESEKELGRIHTVFGSMEIKKLLDVQLNWTALISRSSLPKQTLLGILQQRHELGDWPFPALTEAELQARSRIQQFIDQLSDNTGVSEQEEHDVTAPEQPSNNTSQDNDNNSHPRDTSGEPSLNLPP
ncbi:hypothetical protein PC122_g11743 [Phytophthora cactorum]|nr:hypothetical protein PC122_g11743 [Phytophthora cactorum]